MKRVFAILLMCSCLAMSKETAVRWSNLAGLISGRSVIIGLEDGKRIKGTVVSVEADSISVQTRSHQELVPRKSIREIRLRGKLGISGE